MCAEGCPNNNDTFYDYKRRAFSPLSSFSEPFKPANNNGPQHRNNMTNATTPNTFLIIIFTLSLSALLAKIAYSVYRMVKADILIEQLQEMAEANRDCASENATIVVREDEEELAHMDQWARRMIQLEEGRVLEELERDDITICVRSPTVV